MSDEALARRRMLLSGRIMKVLERIKDPNDALAALTVATIMYVEHVAEPSKNASLLLFQAEGLVRAAVGTRNAEPIA